MENQVEEVKRKIDIVEFIGSFITLKKGGRNFRALCPFHQEKTPSFYISPDRQFWYCFGACQEGGDVIKFLMKWENITFVEALRELAQKAGVKLAKLSFEDQIWKKRERLIGLNNIAVEFYEYILNKTSFGKKALDYLMARTLNPKTIKKFQLGYAPSSWDSLMKFLKKKKYEIAEIYEAGLLVRSEGGKYYDRFRGRIMFPIKDARSNTIGFSGRSLESQDKSAKYINTPETPLYHKRETLYGIDVVKDAIRKEDNAVLVEGEFDMIVPFEHGIENIVAIKGSAVTQEQLIFLKRYTNKITLALDTDAAGEEAVKRGISQAESLEFDIGVVSFDFGKDPDEAVRNDKVKFKKAVKSPIPIYDFIITTAQKKYQGDDPFSKKKIGDEVTPYLASIQNPIVLSYYIKKLAGILEVSEESISSLIRKTLYKKKQKPVFIKTIPIIGKEERQLMIQKYILSMIFQSEKPYEVAHSIFDALDETDFSIPAHRQIITAFLKRKKQQVVFEIQSFVKSLSPQLIPVFDEVYLFASFDFDFKGQNLKKLLYEIKKNSLKRKLADLLSSKEELNEKNNENVKLLNRSLNEVEKIILTL